MVIATFRDKNSDKILLQIEMKSAKANAFRQGDTVWTALEGTTLGNKTFLVNTGDPQSVQDLEALKQIGHA